MNDIQVMCNIIDPSIDWSTKDVSHITNLKVAVNTSRRDLLLKSIKSTYWPEAVPSKMIVASPETRQRRAKTIMSDFVRQSLEGRKFLDFGCGHGDCVNVASEMGAEAIGFDIKRSDEWKSHKGTFTTDPNEIIKNGPYDVVLFYDVFDHMRGSQMESIVWDLRKAFRPRTSIYARCHPYSSRHGNHLYETFNKAYAHLFMTQAELAEVGAVADYTHEVIMPDVVYPAMLQRLGFTIIGTTQVVIKPEQIIEAFTPFLLPLWFSTNKISDQQEINRIMSIQFCDFIMRATI